MASNPNFRRLRLRYVKGDTEGMRGEGGVYMVYRGGGILSVTYLYLIHIWGVGTYAIITYIRFHRHKKRVSL